MVRLENGMHHATWTQSSPFSSSCTDIMKPRSSCRPRIPLSVWLSKALQTAIRTLYSHRNQSSRWIRKNETSTLDTGIQKYRKNDDLLPAIGTYKVFETRCWKVKWRFQWIEQMLSYTWLAGILLLLRSLLEWHLPASWHFPQTMAWIRIAFKRRNMTKICYQREWRLLAYFRLN